MLRKEKIENLLRTWTAQKTAVQGFCAQEVADALNMRRNTVSYELNRLVEDQRVLKISGKPVLFKSLDHLSPPKVNFENKDFFIEKMIGLSSIMTQIEQAKAAVLYPPTGLHTLILGETGVGKSFFAKIMYDYAIHTEVIKKNSPFIVLNCADYAENQQLLVSQLFGYAKGSFTGAVETKDGLVKKAEGGYLFLDEVHNLSSEGQEILFTLMDKGVYRRLGESESLQKSNIRIICATTNDQKNYLLQTFLRRIPILIELPPLAKRSIEDRHQLVKGFVKAEALRVQRKVVVSDNVVNGLLFTEFKGNIGELNETIKLLCAKAFVDSLEQKSKTLNLSSTYLTLMKGNYLNRDILNIYLALKSPFVNAGFAVEASKSEQASISGHQNQDFYGVLSQKYQEFNLQGLSKADVDSKINQEIEQYFSRLIVESRKGLALNVDLSKLVSTELLQETQLFVEKVEKKLHKRLHQEAILGLALHTKAFVERSNQKHQAYNPNVVEIKKEYPLEFELASDYLNIICQMYEIDYSEDEAAFTTMFISTKNLKQVRKDFQIILLCHGRGTASSMADTANQLLDNEWVEAIDMPLNISLQTVKSQVIDVINRSKPTKGVLLMVDMGSLTSLCKEVWEYYNGKLSIGMISGFNMLLILEASRKLLFFEEKLSEILQGITKEDIVSTNYFPKVQQNSMKLIWTVCMTGIGTATKVKKMLEQAFSKMNYINITIEAKNYGELERSLDLAKEKPLVIVGMEPTITDDIPVISLTELFSGHGFFSLLDTLNIEYTKKDMQLIWKETAKNISLDSLLDTLQTIEPKHVLKLIANFVENVADNLERTFSLGIWTRLLIHSCFMVERVMLNKSVLAYKNIEQFTDENHKLMEKIKKELNEVEEFYNIRIPDAEIAYITEIIKENN